MLYPLITHHLTCSHDEARQSEIEGVGFWIQAWWGFNSGPVLCYSLNGNYISKWWLIFLTRVSAPCNEVESTKAFTSEVWELPPGFEVGKEPGFPRSLGLMSKVLCSNSLTKSGSSFPSGPLDNERGLCLPWVCNYFQDHQLRGVQISTHYLHTAP